MMGECAPIRPISFTTTKHTQVDQGQRCWLLLRNADNLSPEQSVKLEGLLATNASLTTAYLL